ncbi:MAG: DUF2569 domain-containing protein [Marinisporobacter sp.]|jgi:hypothetical protein|nr:DUF2569 domain-containing protein [Marinisporobacter sp.]
MSISNNTNEEEHSGIGGWLILFAIGIIMNPFRLSYFTYSIFSDVFSSGAWDSLFFSHVLLKPLIIYELIANSISIIMSLAVLVLFFKKSKFFPKAWIGFVIFSIFVVVIDFLFARQIPIIAEGGFNHIYKSLIHNIVALSVWGTYLKKSIRVKTTFIG